MAEVFCANCCNAKLVKAKHSNKNMMLDKVRCARRRWATRGGNESLKAFATIKHYTQECKAYDSMGEEDIVEYLDTLPEDTDDYHAIRHLQEMGACRL